MFPARTVYHKERCFKEHVTNMRQIKILIISRGTEIQPATLFCNQLMIQLSYPSYLRGNRLNEKAKPLKIKVP